MRKTFLAVAVLFVFVGTALAGPHLNFGKNLNAAQCTPGANNKMVLNIVFQVTGDADSGYFGGYWAIDSYTKHVQVWDMGGGTFCAIVKYNGSFVTVAGTSPSGNSSVSGGVTGTMEGGYSGILTNAAFAPGTKRTKGNIGAKDYGCVITNGDIGSTCNFYSWISDYFSTGDFQYSGAFQWGWIYRAGDNGTWVNANSGGSGDITGN